MAEAVAALGVAAAAVQFFDFSLKALSICKQIRDSEKGATQANQELETCIGSLKQVVEDLKSDVKLTTTQRPIKTARQDCISVITELQKLLDDVKRKSQDKNFAAVKAAFRVMKERRRIEKLQNRLLEAQRRFVAALSVETKNDVARLLEEQGKINATIHNTILPELRTAHQSSLDNHARTHGELANLSKASASANKSTHSMLKDVQQGQEASRKVAETMQVTISGDIARIETQAEDASVNVRIEAERKSFMDSLWYPEIFDRQQSVKPPSFDTFEWIFNDSRLSSDERWKLSYADQLREETRGNFARWLRSDKSLFWISGKPGSGKSSLMSLIQADPRTCKALEDWANGRQVYTFSFYFWRPGSLLQKSIRGLLRSLLWQLAKAKPALIDIVMSTRSAHQDWTTITLLSALRQCLSEFEEDHIFLMVDGLDEYEDSYAELLDLLLDCQQMTSLKICIASRPEPAIKEKLRTFPSLRLQDLNFRDIKTFVERKFGTHSERISQKITDSLIRRSEGVFLWAALVTESILAGALGGDDTETLMERLDSTPGELNALFERLLTNVHKVYYDTLKLCLFHLKLDTWPMGRGWSTRCLVGLITASLPTSRGISTCADFLTLCVTSSERLATQCNGLIEVVPVRLFSGDSPWVFNPLVRKLLQADPHEVETCYYYRIGFVHRSAYDFLFGPENHHDVRCPWVLTKEDLARLTQWTFTGVKIMLQYGPMIVTDFGSIVRPPVYSMISDAFDLTEVVATAAALNYLDWLDDIRQNISIWYPTVVSELHPLLIDRHGRGLVSLTPWYMEAEVWSASLKIGYLNYRWDILAQHPHARAICSEILQSLSLRFLDYDRPLRPEYGSLVTFLRDTHSESLASVTAHIHFSLLSGRDLMASWDTNGALDEQHIMANLVLLAFRVKSRQKRGQEPSQRPMLHNSQDPFILLRRQNLFLGTSPLLYDKGKRLRSLLHIQVPAHGVWVRYAEYDFDFPSCFRLVCLTNDSVSGSALGGPFEREAFCESCDDDVVGICDVHINSFGPVLNVGNSSVYEYVTFPTFTGTQHQFLYCLELLKGEVWANRHGQLNAWQQLYMLACVKKLFKYFWTILTPETIELLAFDNLVKDIEDDQELFKLDV